MKITASAERYIGAPQQHVYRLVRDFREHHPRFLPPEFGELEVETGGVGAGTVVRYAFTLAGRTTVHRVRIGEPEPGRTLIESDAQRRMLTVWTVERAPGGGSLVRIETRWHATGLRALVERIVAPALLGRVYRAELRLLDRYARGEGPVGRDEVRLPRRAAAAG